MKIQKKIQITSILIITLGIIHICATPVILPIFKFSRLNNSLTFMYMFETTGIAMIFVGWLQYFVSKRLGNDRAFQYIFKGTIIFICISGVGAVATMWGNPFAYIILLIALYDVYLLKLIPKTI